jgi:protein-S-isoprenylcysteine O-methyltransferase Ste14
MGHDDIAVRLIIAAQLLALCAVRGYFGAPPAATSAERPPKRRAEPLLLTLTLGIIAVLHFGAMFAYLLHPPLLRWSSFESAARFRWLGILISCFGVAGEMWAAVSLGTSYSPMLRVADERAVITAGPYRWIRHPLYSFWLLAAAGW